MPSRIEGLCTERGLKMTGQRRVIARVLSDATDHPDVEQLHRRATEIDPRISVATVYRTLRLFEEANILERHEFRSGRARYGQGPARSRRLADRPVGSPRAPGQAGLRQRYALAQTRLRRMKVPLIALEVVLGFVVPVGWGVWELISLRRDRQRSAERDRHAAGEASVPRAAAGEDPA